MKVETVPLNTIKMYFRNPRINDDTVKALIKSIERYGFNVPIVIDKNNVIVTGHARYKALTQMGKQTAEVIKATDLTEDQARKFRIEDNTIQEISTWEEDILFEEVKDIKTWDNLLEMFDGTLDDVLKGLGAVELPDLNVDEIVQPTSYESPLTQEQQEKKKEIETENDKVSKNFVICPYCGEYNSKQDILNSIEQEV